MVLADMSCETRRKGNQFTSHENPPINDRSFEDLPPSPAGGDVREPSHEIQYGTKSKAALLFCVALTALALTSPFPGRAEQSEPNRSHASTEVQGSPEAEPIGEVSSLNWWTSLRENMRLNTDFVSRFETNSGANSFSTLNALGLDFHSVAATETGNIGTFVLQPYLVRRDRARPVMPHLEGPSDWEVELHDFYFNLTRWGRGRTNVKIGHFDVPFGLEPMTDTHFRIYQLMPMENLGMKKDWGVSLNGVLPKFDYEVALTRGSGFQYDARDGNYAVAGRIGTPSDRNFAVGIAAFEGRVLHQRRGLIVPRKRVGFDATWILGQFTLKAETSVGKDFDRGVFQTLGELDWLNLDGRLEAYVQTIYRRRRMPSGWTEKVAPRVGVNWLMSRSWSIEAQYGPEMVMMATRPEDYEFRVQLRFLHLN